jgi:two-component system NtrC family sensor kinase
MLGQIEVGTKGRAYILTDTGQRIYKGMAKTYTGELLTASSNLIKRPWSVIVEAPRDEFLGPLRSVRNAAFLTSFLGLGLLIVVLSTIVRSITKPIQALVIAARAIGSGDLSYRIKNSASDELGTLSQSFNEMSERLDSNRKQNVQLQSQLIQAEKLSAVGQLIAAVAHELNNPLAAISGYVQMAQLDAIPKKLQEDLSHVYNNVLRCRKVVDNLLFFVRQSGPERKKFSLNDAVRSALELLEYRLLKTEDVEVRSELNHTTPEIVGDFQQIVQVIVNLISNSCDAMEGVVRYPETKKLVIRSGFAGDKVFLDIEDNGSGIPAEIQNKIFEPFFTTKDAGHGTGLGLPICQQIVQAHGGEISVRSLQSQGTIFHLEFPVANITAQEQVNEDSEEKVFAAVPAKKILVADDEKDIANLISRLLTADGDLVDVAYNGGDALDIIGRKDFDLIISDIEMEHAKGMDLYSALSRKRAFPKTKMLFITGDILNPKVLEFLSQTKSEYLVKPFDIEALRQAARRLLS